MNRTLRILSIGAHPDDCELTTGGTCILYRRLGHTVKFLYATNGDAGHHRKGGAELAAIRAKEAEAACATAGIDFEILDNQDGCLQTDLETRWKMIRAIRSFQPDLIFTHRPNDYHPDHRNTALLVQDASYLVRVPNICPETPVLKYSPVILHMADSFQKPMPFQPVVVVSIDDVFLKKAEMAHCHKSQFYEWLPWIDGYEGEVPAGDADRLKWLAERIATDDSAVADRFRPQLAARYGGEAGSTVRYAEAFELCEYGAGLTEERLLEFFPF